MTGLVNVTVIGMATPTTWPLVGWTDAMDVPSIAGATAAMLVCIEVAIATITIPAAAHARRTALAMDPLLAWAISKDPL
ncbi:hypothetical protein MSAR_39780 [Mycolicibacterium sarraceniae]|uniref:Uncharacterized protein n=1 Tax=Mycolicibacterium sarraceniae TaxID=1534348 RepID=A0A7I7SUZ1_9MYCO|nr:hypothetical protein MSAR_39780 [Mycolicibacterium sarraceniae]